MKRNNTKRIVSTVVAGLMVCGLFAGCGSNGGSATSSAASSAAASSASKKIVVAATPTPHGEILTEAKALLAKEGYELEIKEYTDYVQPNNVVNDGEMDANFFQHTPYLDNFNKENKTELVSVAKIHYEPLGIYAGKTKTIADLKDKATIAVPNDTTNEARALMLLEANGIIKIKEGAGINATVKDIVENPKNVEIVELDAAMVSTKLQEVDLVVLNGNYALNAGLNASKDALAIEKADSEAAQTYANIIVVKKGNEGNEGVKALVKVLQSDEIKKFINEKYDGAVVPM